MLNLDMVLFEQVLFNLLDNAAKYAPEGSRIQIRAYRDGDRVVLQVIDEGEGIPPRDVERIFDKFYRVKGMAHSAANGGAANGGAANGGAANGGAMIGAASGAASGAAVGAAVGVDSQRAGTGLGLAICRGFVEAMDGTISAANRADRPGAVISISLPVPVGATLPEETMT